MSGFGSSWTLPCFLQKNSWLLFGFFCFFSLPCLKCPFVTDVESVWFWSDRPRNAFTMSRVMWGSSGQCFPLLPGISQCHKCIETSAAQAWSPARFEFLFHPLVNVIQPSRWHRINESFYGPVLFRSTHTFNFFSLCIQLNVSQILNQGNLAEGSD